MDERRTVSLLMALALLVYGVYIASYVPAQLIAPLSPLLLIGFVLQAVLAVVAAVGVWRGQRWAAGVVVALGVVIALTWLVESFVLGLVGYRTAVLIALVAVVLTVVAAMYLDRRIGRRAA